MKISEALAYARGELKSEEAAKIASILLSSFLGKKREYLILHENEELSSFEGFKSWVLRYNKYEPLEYITGKVSFYAREFDIYEGVLIPRPETELLVELTDKLIKKHNLTHILEIGTGSGIIAIMLALLNPDIFVTAGDINPKAIALAKQNAKKFDLKNVEFVLSDLDVCIEGDFELLVSNPPYISPDEKLEKHVLKEPHDALFSQNDGLFMLENLVNIAKKRKLKYLACEMGYDQKEKMQEILAKLKINEVQFHQDLSSLDRGFIARIN